MKKCFRSFLTAGLAVAGLLIVMGSAGYLTRVPGDASEMPETDSVLAEEIFAAFDPADAVGEIPEQAEEKAPDSEERNLPAEEFRIYVEEDGSATLMNPTLPNARLGPDGKPVYRAENLK